MSDPCPTAGGRHGRKPESILRPAPFICPCRESNADHELRRPVFPACHRQYPQEGLNLYLKLRRLTLYPLSYGGSGRGGQVSLELQGHQKGAGYYLLSTLTLKHLPVVAEDINLILSKPQNLTTPPSRAVNPIPHWLKNQIKTADITESLAGFTIFYKTFFKFC